MKDRQVQSEKLRRDAAECALIRNLATDLKKRELLPDGLNTLTCRIGSGASYCRQR
ncbi:hypothetical protein BwSH20_77920 [Bradyrhizobium ottawaense]|nr:hypothetical protein BwSH20_77920 [Bradyrhizobium ottawaense]